MGLKKSLTYVWQEKVFGVVLHQELLSLHKQTDVDPFALLSVGTVLIIKAGDPASAVVHWTSDLTLTWGARPVQTTGVHRAVGFFIIITRGAAWNSKKRLTL